MRGSRESEEQTRNRRKNAGVNKNQVNLDSSFYEFNGHTLDVIMASRCPSSPGRLAAWPPGRPRPRLQQLFRTHTHTKRMCVKPIHNASYPNPSLLFPPTCHWGLILFSALLQLKATKNHSSSPWSPSAPTYNCNSLRIFRCIQKMSTKVAKPKRQNVRQRQ